VIIARTLLRESQVRRTVHEVAAAETAIGARIRAVREQAGIKAQELAAAIGLDPSALSNIERGKRSVKTDELAKIAQVLNVSPLALLDDESLPARMPVAPRAVANGIQNGTAYARLLGLAELHEALEHAGIRSESHLDGAPSVENLGWKDAADALADWASRRLSDDVGGDNRFSSIADAIELAFGIDVIVEPHDDDPLAGAAIADPSFPLIFVNADQPTQRAIFTLAHELGHLLADHGEPITLDEEHLSARNDNERLANAFAARLLMPEDRVRKIIDDRGRGVEALAFMTYTFGVSFQSLVYRLHNLRIVNAETRDRLQSVGWHGLLRAIERPDINERVGPQVRQSLLGRLGSQPQRRAPRWLVDRTLAGYARGVVSIRPLAGLLNEHPDDLLGEVESLSPASTDILRSDVRNDSDDDASDDELFDGSPV